MAEPPRLSEILLPWQKSVRHGLVKKAEDWPYYFDFVNITGGSCQLPLQPERFHSMGVGA